MSSLTLIAILSIKCSSSFKRLDIVLSGKYNKSTIYNRNLGNFILFFLEKYIPKIIIVISNISTIIAITTTSWPISIYNESINIFLS